jgi:hypothetical protein
MTNLGAHNPQPQPSPMVMSLTPNTGSNPDDAFIAFNLSQIPSGVINSIRLQIFFQDSAGAGSQFFIYGATGAWSEDESGTNPTRDFNQSGNHFKRGTGRDG